MRCGRQPPEWGHSFERSVWCWSKKRGELVNVQWEGSRFIITSWRHCTRQRPYKQSGGTPVTFTFVNWDTAYSSLGGLILAGWLRLSTQAVRFAWTYSPHHGTILWKHHGWFLPTPTKRNATIQLFQSSTACVPDRSQSSWCLSPPGASTAITFVKFTMPCFLPSTAESSKWIGMASTHSIHIKLYLKVSSIDAKCLQDPN